MENQNHCMSIKQGKIIYSFRSVMTVDRTLLRDNLFFSRPDITASVDFVVGYPFFSP